MKKLSKALNLSGILLGFLLTVVSMLFLIWVYMEGGGRDREVVPMLMMVATLPSLVSGIMILRIVYKLWKAIQGGRTRTSPEVAVALLFIPFFNLYWVFQAYWGLAKDFNAYVQERNLPVPNLSEGLALAVCVLILLSMIPFLGLIFMIVGMVLQLVFVGSLIRSYNALSENAICPSP